MHTPTLSARLLLGLAFSTGLAACSNDNDSNTPAETPSTVKLDNYSTTPVLAKMQAGFESVKMYSLISSDDKLAASPDFMFGGSADGAGLLRNPDGKGFTMLVNNEDNMAISRVQFDETLRPVRGEYVLNSDGGRWRLCSATLVTPEEHGFGPYFLSAGESAVDAQTHLIQPFADNNTQSTPKGIKGLGYWSAENAVPLPKTAYTGKTVILTGEDASDASGGQVALYVSNAVGDLEGGQQYMLRRKDLNQKEKDITLGQKYEVEFVAIPDYKNLTGTQMQAQVDPLKAIKFGRVEDLDYRKGGGANGREVYFNVTGQDFTGVNADQSRTKWGRTYRLLLNEQNPLQGTLEVVLDGDDRNGKAKDFQNPDNICVTQNYVYIQEDSNGYGTETHDAYLYQYNIATGELKKVMELDHHRTETDKDKYNVTGSAYTPAPSTKGSWEYGALVDVSDVVGQPNTFTLCIQPHSWRAQKYKDGGAKPNNGNDQASQVVVLSGLPR
ncbi:hypothetical protein SAMN06265337_0557 [Hymenobacter gelipurpurascens]|uniref:DUF839 domain-containing protein n=1 Tax=Hymenobacter gelipurpurascens TaxID=89968 RepID=A0A212T773_9BACT|nr:hypothetical protein [Hymenobacter gelipurpurascens]SNC61878.1 hypothetical protein SAMN06265337_0557 [Hymenobacter gelipurpurascens]